MWTVEKVERRASGKRDPEPVSRGSCGGTHLLAQTLLSVAMFSIVLGVEILLMRLLALLLGDSQPNLSVWLLVHLLCRACKNECGRT